MGGYIILNMRTIDPCSNTNFILFVADGPASSSGVSGGWINCII